MNTQGVRGRCLEDRGVFSGCGVVNRQADIGFTEFLRCLAASNKVGKQVGPKRRRG